jgi:hypothetical protein
MLDDKEIGNIIVLIAVFFYTGEVAYRTILPTMRKAIVGV